ncbi:MAG: recombination regulator RecX [Lachnospiraceae bacterium]|nr:recombination regulator RecX [Lachnospiraceae bacterium]
MMIVRSIQELSKKRFKITLENGLSFVLYKGELSSYDIRVDNEIKEDHYTEIVEKVLPKRAKLRAMNLLKLRPYTVKGLRDKLSDGGYPEFIIDIAIGYVSSYGYLDDRKYASQYIYTYRSRKNRKKIINDLLLKGVPKSIIMEALDEEPEGEMKEAEEEQIKKFLTKKGFYDNQLSYEEKAKLSASLYRKGFDPSLIGKYINLT